MAFLANIAAFSSIELLVFRGEMENLDPMNTMVSPQTGMSKADSVTNSNMPGLKSPTASINNDISTMSPPSSSTRIHKKSKIDANDHPHSPSLILATSTSSSAALSHAKIGSPLTATASEQPGLLSTPVSAKKKKVVKKKSPGPTTGKTTKSGANKKTKVGGTKAKENGGRTKAVAAKTGKKKTGSAASTPASTPTKGSVTSSPTASTKRKTPQSAPMSAQKAKKRKIELEAQVSIQQNIHCVL